MNNPLFFASDGGDRKHDRNDKGGAHTPKRTRAAACLLLLPTEWPTDGPYERSSKKLGSTHTALASWSSGGHGASAA